MKKEKDKKALRDNTVRLPLEATFADQSDEASDSRLKPCYVIVVPKLLQR